VPFARLSIQHVKITCCVCLNVLKLFHPTANKNVDGVDLLPGAGLLNFINICIQQTPVNAPYYFVDYSRCSVEFPQLHARGSQKRRF
jgi:hypothetical protein